MLPMRQFLLGVFLAAAGAHASAAIITYEFSGVVPPGASAHSQVADGETWTAVIEVDDTVPDADANPQRGSYVGSVISSTITFSGGYSQTQTATDTQTLVFDDRTIQGVPNVVFDGIQVRRQGPSSLFTVQVTVEQASGPVPVLSSDALVGPGVSFDQSPTSILFTQLAFVDELLPGESVGYDTLDAANTMFTSFSASIDTDGDGVPDELDNCTEVVNPDQVDSNGDGYGNLCDADLNNDGIVNAQDLGLLRLVFFTPDADADFNSDGIVNAQDLGLLRIGFFQPPGPSGLVP